MHKNNTKMTLVGIISDTHNLLRPEAIKALKGSDLIIHAGDIGDPDIIKKLNLIAPVHAVRGNVDKATWANDFPINDVIEISGKYIYVLHNIRELDLDPAAASFDVVVSGHSHKPKIETKNGVLFINPGSTGPRRFTLPVSIARVQIIKNKISAELLELSI